MKCRNGGKYDEFENNCQDFVKLLLRGILGDSVVDQMEGMDFFKL